MPAAAAQVAGPKKSILIVEDERPLAHALELKLGHSGYETHTARTGVEGLKEAKTDKYDLILLDLILPELDGFALLEELHKAKKTTPIVILSNLGQEEDKKRVEKYNIAKYCVKSNMPLAAIVNTIKVLTS
jgi:DNA-binding response OmpR family regulator